MGVQFLKEFKPDERLLLRRISTHIDDEALELIANEDPVGGDARRARFIDALRAICDGGILKKQSDFASWDKFHEQDVTEILEFSRFAEPDSDQCLGRWRGTRGHWSRAFACAVLLRSYGDSEVRGSAAGAYNDVILQLVESVRRLDAGFEPETMAMLAWFIIRACDDAEWNEIEHDQRAFAGVGILSLAVNSKNMVSHDTIMKLTDWLIAEEKELSTVGARVLGIFQSIGSSGRHFSTDTAKSGWPSARSGQRAKSQAHAAMPCAVSGKGYPGRRRCREQRSR